LQKWITEQKIRRIEKDEFNGMGFNAATSLRENKKG